MLTKLLALLVLVAGCAGGPCVRNSDCNAREMCSATGVCVTEIDDPVGDAGADADAPIDAPPDAATDGGP